MKFETTFPKNPFGLSDQEKQILRSLPEDVLKKIGQAAACLEDDLDNDELFEMECRRIAELATLKEERVRTQIRSLMVLEKRQRAMALRSRQRFLWCVLVYFCQLDHGQAAFIISLLDEPTDGGGGCGFGMGMV